MSSIRKKTLEAWLTEAMNDPDKDAKCSMIVLVHMVGQQQKEIHTTKFGNGKSWSGNELGAMFHGKATAYCQDLPGSQTFQLLAFYGDRTTPEAFQPFVINVNADSFNGLATEPPTEQGRLQASMRREEMLIQQVYRRQQVMDEYTIKVIESQASTIRSLSTENRDAFTIVKDMLMEKALDDHKRKMEQLNFERSTGERKKWMGWIPALTNQILGREVFPQSTADTSLVESITESLSEDDIMKLTTVIKPELMGPLAARMHEFMLKKKKEEESLKQLSAMKSPDPEADAAGDIVHVNGNGKT